MQSDHARLRTAVVGLSFGKSILANLHQDPACGYFEVVGVCDLRRDVAMDLALEYQVRHYTSLEEVLEDSDVEAVALFTGPNGRASLMRTIIRAGKDVITTKPFELDAIAAASVLEEARLLGRTIHLNSPSPEPTQEVKQIQTWCLQHDLGRLVSARGEIWASYMEQEDGSWLDDPVLCPGGAMMRLGIYLINDVLHFAGPPQKMSFSSSRFRTGRPTPDNALLTMTFDSGCLASVFTSFCVQDGDSYSNGLALQFERGSIYRNIGSARMVSGHEFSHLSLVRQDSSGCRTVEDAIFGECSGAYQWKVFYDAVRNRVPLSASYIRHVTEGINVLEFVARHQGSLDELTLSLEDEPQAV